ncbi:MAG: pro-sigmaK processing inhibitor BofA family protein [Clostridiales bacterium]|nr:pro-sigmaK processing inhibitor BofA family protein [Clostridiales bacterium]
MDFLQDNLVQNAALAGLGLVLILLAATQVTSLWRVLERVILNCMVGMVLLTFINTVSFWTGLALPVNSMTLAASGFLGAPGIIALAALKILF